MANGKAPKPKVSAGQPARRVTRASTTPTAAGMKKPTAVAPAVKQERTQVRQQMMSWDKKSSGHWTSRQAMSLNPGGEEAISRLRHSPKFTARSKKVIRPRTKKVIHTS